MKKVTLSVDEIAQRENRAREARRRLRALSNRSVAKIGRASWTREELHERWLSVVRSRQLTTDN
jgi:hypothetical protein